MTTMTPANGARGEATVKLGDVTVVLAAEMEDLARLSDVLGNPTMPDLFKRLMGGEVRAALWMFRLFAVRGAGPEGELDAEAAGAAAAAAYRLDDVGAIAAAVEILFAALTRKQPAKERPEKNV